MAKPRKRQPDAEDPQLSLFGAPEPDRDEQIRQARDEPLEADRPGPLRDTSGPAYVLPGARQTSVDADPGARLEAGRSRPAGGGVPAEGRPAEHGGPASRGSDPDGARLDLWTGAGDPGHDDRVGDADDARDGSQRRGRRDRRLAFRPRTQDDLDRKSTRLNSSHTDISRMPSS